MDGQGEFGFVCQLSVKLEDYNRYGRINIRKLRDDNLVPAKMVKRESIAVTTDPCWPRRDPP